MGGWFGTYSCYGTGYGTGNDCFVKNQIKNPTAPNTSRTTKTIVAIIALFFISALFSSYLFYYLSFGFLFLRFYYDPILV